MDKIAKHPYVILNPVDIDTKDQQKGNETPAAKTLSPKRDNRNDRSNGVVAEARLGLRLVRSFMNRRAASHAAAKSAIRTNDNRAHQAKKAEDTHARNLEKIHLKDKLARERLALKSAPTSSNDSDHHRDNYVKWKAAAASAKGSTTRINTSRGPTDVDSKSHYEKQAEYHKSILKRRGHDVGDVHVDKPKPIKRTTKPPPVLAGKLGEDTETTPQPTDAFLDYIKKTFTSIEVDIDALSQIVKKYVQEGFEIHEITHFLVSDPESFAKKKGS
jgi:hypothetical protein